MPAQIVFAIFHRKPLEVRGNGTMLNINILPDLHHKILRIFRYTKISVKKGLCYNRSMMFTVENARNPYRAVL